MEPVQTKSPGLDQFRKDRALEACDKNHHPSHDLHAHAITGTNGKTTLTFLVEHLLNHLHRPTGIIGTIYNRILPAFSEVAHLTTPGSVELQETLKEIQLAGALSVVMEVTSHALDQFRVWGTRFKSVGITNLTQDHLDYHHDMQSYFAAKTRLFTEYETEFRIINLSQNEDNSASHWTQKLISLCPSKGLITFNVRKSPNAASIPCPEKSEIHLDAFVKEMNLTGITAEIKLMTPEGTSTHIFKSPLVGGFNLENLIQATAIGLTEGFSIGAILPAFSYFQGAPGRMERVNSPEFSIFVDYAHTPDALEKTLMTLRELMHKAANPAKKLWVVFGCGGDRDIGKRPQMGRIASKLAHGVIITSDNPRTEAPEKIMNDIVAGIDPNAEGSASVIHRETSRKAAIEFALKNLAKGDVLLIAGKGHETYQILPGATPGTTVTVDFDDRKVVKEFLNSAAAKQ